MCGIAGAFNYKKNKPVSLDVIKGMNDEIIHRGPDDEGYYVKGNIALAFRRLSIIDLYTGNQPIHNEDKTIWVVFNGEIYNYVELRDDLMKKGHSFYTKSDTEVIVHLYEEYGEDFPLHLNGMYGIALWDEKKENLLLVRDRPGIKPLYYAETEDGLMFASEIKALLKAGISREPDFEAINQYLSYGFVPSPLTGFMAIRKLTSGHMIICSNNTFSEKKFWDLSHIEPALEYLDEKQTIDIFIDELKAVLYRQTRSDVPVGIFLSGGIDSSLIASVAAEKCNLKLNAFTIGFEEESYNELVNTRAVARRLGLPLHEIVLSERDILKEIDRIMSFLDEPFFDYSTIPVYFVSKLARTDVKTVLSGDGGDELFGGYPTHYIHRITEKYRKLPKIIRNLIKTVAHNLPESHGYLSPSYKLKRFTYGSDFPYDEAHYRWKLLFDAEEKKKLLCSDIMHDISNLESFHVMEQYFLKAKKSDFKTEDQLMYVDFKTHLQDDFLQKTDRMSMANSLEVRVPLLDNAIIDFSRTVSAEMKIKGFQTKYLMRKALSRFQHPGIAFGKKRGFTPPLALWIKNGLKDYMLSSLSGDAISKLGFLNHTHINRIVSAHLNGKAENSRAIWALVSLMNWYRNHVSQ
jgi:asparagine synthase (glutamine-hydrolysing)